MDKKCNTCVHFNVKGDYSGYCMSKDFKLAVDVKYTGNSKHSMPCRHTDKTIQMPWEDQMAEIEKWARIRINGDEFGCVFHEAREGDDNG